MCEPLLWARSTIDCFGTCLQSVLTFCVNPDYLAIGKADGQASSTLGLDALICGPNMNECHLRLPAPMRLRLLTPASPANSHQKILGSLRCASISASTTGREALRSQVQHRPLPHLAVQKALLCAQAASLLSSRKLNVTSEPHDGVWSVLSRVLRKSQEFRPRMLTSRSGTKPAA